MWKLCVFYFFIFCLKGHFSSDLKINSIFLGPYKSSWLWALCLLSPMEARLRKHRVRGGGSSSGAHGKDLNPRLPWKEAQIWVSGLSSRPSFSRIGSTWCLNARTGIVLENFSSGGFLQTPITSLLSNYEDSKVQLSLERVSGAGINTCVPNARARGFQPRSGNSTPHAKNNVSVLMGHSCRCWRWRGEVSYQGFSLPLTPSANSWPRDALVFDFSKSQRPPAPPPLGSLAWPKVNHHSGNLEFTPPSSAPASSSAFRGVLMLTLPPWDRDPVFYFFRTLTALSTHPAHTRLMKLPCIAHLL